VKTCWLSLCLILLAIFVAGCGGKKSPIVVTAKVSKSIYIAPISSPSYNAYTEIKNVSGKDIQYDYLIIGFVTDEFKGLKQMVMKANKDGAIGGKGILAAGKTETHSNETNGWTYNLLADRGDSDIYLVAYYINDGKAASPLYSAKLPELKDLPQMDYLSKDGGGLQIQLEPNYDIDPAELEKK